MSRFSKLWGCFSSCLNAASRAPHQRVRVHEHTLAVVGQSPAVQFGERHSQVRTLHQGQMSHVARVHNVHHTDLVKNGAQRISAAQTA